MGKKTFLILGPLFILLSYQACSKNLTFTRDRSDSVSTAAPTQEVRLESGNGEGYSGKLTRFDHRDPLRPCAERTRLNQPLPNAQIFSYATGGNFLVRKDCADLNPQALNPSEISVTAPGQISYSGMSFTEVTPSGDFDVLAAQCPAGFIPRANPVRQNLISDSQDLLSSRHLRHPGADVKSFGALAGLPLFDIFRIPTTLTEQWQRLTQDPTLQIGRRYVYSFFVRKSPGQSAIMQSYKEGGGHEILVTFNLNDGSARIDRVVGVANVSNSVQILEQGFFVSTYFTMNETAMVNIGIAPAAPLVGAELGATLIQLEDVSTFCGP